MRTLDRKPILQGRYVRLEPLEPHHADGLVAAATEDPSLYKWSPVPVAREAADAYIRIASELRDAGRAVPFVTVRISDGRIVGSTRFFDIEKWAWPAGHAERERGPVDGCEIGYSWLAASAIRSGANTEAKLLMLTHAFEEWRALRVCLHTDVRNARSRAAIERIGGKFEGILRSHRLAADFIARDSARFSITAAEWPELKGRLRRMLDR